MVGELVIAQAMLGQIVQDLPEGTSSRLLQILEEVVHHTRELKDSVMSMRAQPVGSVFQRMPRLVREVSTKTKKKVRLETVGETTEVDRSIIERLSDPLTHIIRNSVDHGIESPADRVAAGKNEEGIVRLSAGHRGGRIVIEISDDGAGINTERVLKKARESGLVSPDAVLSEEEIGNLIMLPGFSTAEKVSDISGRGVGMDVVRSNIQEIGGRISLKSERGRGMKIQLSLPLTLAVMDGMVIKIGEQTYVMPLSAIVECLRPARSEICNLVGTRGMLQLRGEFVPVVQLGELLDISSKAELGRAGRHHHRRGRRHALRPRRRRIMRSSASGDQKHRGQLRGGARTCCGYHSRQWACRIYSGRREVVRSCRRFTAWCRQGSRLGVIRMPNAIAMKVLVVDDQNSVRQMTRITLEQLGIRHIHEAENGVAAMETASLQPIDLIISDYNMPEMDGLGLLRAVRGHPAVRKVPFILLTGRGDRELVVKAANAGVNNYLVKPFTAEILRQKIEQVVGKLS